MHKGLKSSQFHFGRTLFNKARWGATQKSYVRKSRPFAKSHPVSNFLQDAYAYGPFLSSCTRFERIRGSGPQSPSGSKSGGREASAYFFGVKKHDSQRRAEFYAFVGGEASRFLQILEDMS